MPVSKLKEIAELYHQRKRYIKRKQIFLDHQQNLIEQKELLMKACKHWQKEFQNIRK